MMIDLYLDDARPCPKGFALARDAAECIEMMSGSEVRVLSLDFDLGWEQPNAMEVVRYMVANGVYAAVIYLHTSSAAGKMQMFHMLYSNKPDHVQIYSHPMPDSVIEQIAVGTYRVG
ncbi:MAG: hypothetical protein K0Q59_3081 [Paenibacillus sp.]|jgi:hypothetical protein|nr:hypothetical protein [Paenibacillus sp.]